MNKNFLILTMLLVLVLSSCSKKEVATTEEKSVQEIYTSVALTAQAQFTNTPVPSATTRLTETPTPLPSLTPTVAVVASATAQLTALSVVSYCDNSAYVSDVTIPDGMIFYPGSSFTKTWLIKNTGTCTWNKSYVIAFVNGNAMNGETTALTASTAPGEQIKVSVEMVAPSTAGTYIGYWKLKNEAGSSFGQSVYVQIVVSTSASTSTPTFTATASGYTTTPTSTTSAATATATKTKVPKITNTPTETPVPTETPTATETPSS
jgi:hypothetical protein